jgi:hypothetical protein
MDANSQNLLFVVGGVIAGPAAIYLWHWLGTLGLRADAKRLATEIANWGRQVASLEKDKAKLAKQVSDMQPAFDAVSQVENMLAEMRRVWVEHPNVSDVDNELDCQRVLRDNLWVLEPDYIVDHERGFFATGQTPLQNIYARHFPEIAATQPFDDGKHIQVLGSIKPDLCGFAFSNASFLGCTEGKPKEIYLLIELKSSRISLEWDHVAQVNAYAYGLLRNARVNLQEKRIECLVIGKSIGPDVNDAHLRFGVGANSGIRIVPMTWQQLYDRAERMVAPVLGRARNPSAAATIIDLGQERAARRAAA